MRYLSWTLLAGLILAGAAGPASGGDILLNGSFERPDLVATLTDGLPYYFYGRTNLLDDWTIVGSFLGFLESRPPFWVAAAGNQYIELESGFGQAIHQTLNTVPGAAYTIRFAYAPVPDPLFMPGPDDSLSLFWNGVLVATVDGTDATIADLDWRYFEFTVTATGTTSVIRFEDGFAGLSFIGPLLDDVSVTQVAGVVPEPAGVALFGLGAIGLGAYLGYRRRFVVSPGTSS